MATKKSKSYEKWMTKEDYNMFTKNMSQKQKKDFNDNWFENTNTLMSLGAVGLIKKRNETLSPVEIAKARKQIPEHYPWVDPKDIKPFKPEK